MFNDNLTIILILILSFIGLSAIVKYPNKKGYTIHKRILIEIIILNILQGWFISLPVWIFALLKVMNDLKEGDFE